MVEGALIQEGRSAPAPRATLSTAPSRGDRLAFVLSGGSTSGALQVGCLEALLESGIHPDLIVGTSVGAMNGAWMAMWPNLEGVQRLKEVWLSLRPRSLYPERRARIALRFVFGRDYLYANHSLARLVESQLPGATFEALRVPLFIAATNLDTGEPYVFRKGPLLPAILASTAIPGILPPVQIGEHRYIDGGVLSNCNVEAAWKQGATTIVLIECPRPMPRKRFGIFDPLLRTAWIAQRRLCQMEIQLLQRVCRILVLEPYELEAPMSGKDFSKTRLLIEQAKSWTDQFLHGPEGQQLIKFTENTGSVSRCMASKVPMLTGGDPD